MSAPVRLTSVTWTTEAGPDLHLGAVHRRSPPTASDRSGNSGDSRYAGELEAPPFGTIDRMHTIVCDIVVCMPQVDRFSVTMPPELGEGVRRAAARQGTSVSTWLTEAAADKLRNELLGAALDQWEAEDGPFTQAELDEAASRLGLAPRSDVA